MVDTSTVERRIDKLVYSFCCLTIEGIAPVEGTVRKLVLILTFSNVQIRKTQPIKKNSEKNVSPSIKVSAYDQEPKKKEKLKKECTSQFNNKDSPARINEAKQKEVLYANRQIFRKGPELSRGLASIRITEEPGNDSIGSKRKEILDSDIRTAAKRGNLGNRAGILKSLCKTIEGYDRKLLKDQFLVSFGGPWVVRQQAVRVFTRIMGFRRAGEKIQDTVRFLINGLLREDRLESDGQMIRRKS
jgi:hypothetical protein